MSKNVGRNIGKTQVVHVAPHTPSDAGDFLNNGLPGKYGPENKWYNGRQLVVGKPQQMMQYPNSPKPLTAAELEAKGIVGFYFQKRS